MVKRTNRWLSLFLSAAVVLSGISLPTAAPAKNVEAAAVQEDEGREVNFNKGWKFYFGDISGAEAEDYNDAQWEDIIIPHDFSISQEFSREYEGESGFLPGGTGWYRKSVAFPTRYKGKTLVLNFDGVYNHAYVYVNGQKLGENHYGYNDFAFDISKYVTCDGKTENVIAVKAVNSFPSSRWYSGSGIYRDVTMYVTDPVHVAKNGTYVTTPDLENQKDGDVTVNVKATVQNDGSASASATVRVTVEDAQGKAVSKEPTTQTATLNAGTSQELTFSPVVNKPNLWDCDNPNLYYVKTEVLVGGVVEDTYKTEFGFRYFKFDANTGFSLNGKPMKLKGVCLHHDQGALGSASYYDAVYRQVRIMKEMGCNSIRTSHNTGSKMLISICNKLGILVQEEIFDGWTEHKNHNDGDIGTHFAVNMDADNQVLGGSTSKTWAQFVTEAAVNRDKNAPSIVTWSIGNELPTVYCDMSVCTATYPGISLQLIGWIKGIDATKPITMGDNNANFGSSDFRTVIDGNLAAAGGVIGLNYAPGSYVSNHNLQPTWPLVATETASAVNSRGIYSTRNQRGENSDYQCTSYDTKAVDWGQRARAAWYPIISNDFMSGTYVWTGFDYIGEPTPWNGLDQGSDSNDVLAVPNSSYFGIVDTAGFPKDSYYLYTSQWRDDKTTLHLVPGSWNQDDLLIENGKVYVDIYSNAEKVELYLNDKLIGTANRKLNDSNTGLYQYGTYTSASNDSSKCTAVALGGSDALAAEFNVTYEEGTLSAKAYDAQGNEIKDTIGTKLVETNKDRGTALKVTPEKTEIQADGSSLCYIAVDVVDADGRFVPGADNKINFSLVGNGSIVAVDNGNASTIDKFQQPSVLLNDRTANIKAFSGKALVIVRSTDVSGGFTLRVTSDGLQGQNVNVNTTGSSQVSSVYVEEYDLKTEYESKMGSIPEFQTKVNATLTDGTKKTGTVEWSKVSADMYNVPGTYAVRGTLTVGQEKIKVTALWTVLPVIVAIQNYSMVTAQGKQPSLPKTLPGILPNGKLYGSYEVAWDSVTESDLAEKGILTVDGKALAEGEQFSVTATVRIEEEVERGEQQIAKEEELSGLTASVNGERGVSDSVYNIIDGVTDGGGTARSRWTNWSARKASQLPNIVFTWPVQKKLSSVKLWFYDDSSSATAPESVTFEISRNGKTDFEQVEFTSTDMVVNNVTTFTFNEPVYARALRITMKQLPAGNGHPDPCVGISECEIYTASQSYDVYFTALLDTLTLNEKSVNGFSAGALKEDGYAESVVMNQPMVVNASARDNASVTIVPPYEEDGKKVVRVLVESEDHAVFNEYKVVIEELADQALKNEASSVLSSGENLSQKDYTSESWSAYQAAIQGVREALAKGDKVSKVELTSALEKLKAAKDNLKKVSSGIPGTGSAPQLPKVGTTYPVGNASYKVTQSAQTGGTVTYVKPVKKTLKKINIPATVKISGVTFKVTAIAANACKNNKKLTSVTIGKNVKTIGNSAFAGDGKLKKIKIKSTVLSKVGRKAFKGINAKAKIKVPKKCLKAYKKKLKGKGQKSSVKIQK